MPNSLLAELIKTGANIFLFNDGCDVIFLTCD
jgi:hypothetical protein